MTCSQGKTVSTHMGLLQLVERGVTWHLSVSEYLQEAGPLHTASRPASAQASATLPSSSRVPFLTGTL